MPSGEPVIRRLGANGERVTLRLAEQSIDACVGESVTFALLATGRLATSRGLKYRRPRGAFCLSGDCGSCLVRIDGRPNMKACVTRVHPSMQLEFQNVFPSVHQDPSGIMDRVFGPTMDHHHFVVRPRIANQIMQEVARTLAGLGTLPDGEHDEPQPARTRSPDVLVIGAGASGRAAFATLRSLGIDSVIVDRHDARWLEIADHTAIETSTAMFGAYAEEGIFAGVAHDGRRTRLELFTPKHVVFANGTHEPTILVSNNDLPGVVSARGFLHQLRDGHGAPSQPCVVVGDGEFGPGYAEALGATAFVHADDVLEIEGAHAVEGVRTKDTSIPCHVVAFAPAPSPAFELARQAGAATRFAAHGHALMRDRNGRCALTKTVPWQLWACGSVAGEFHDPAQDGIDTAARVAAAVRGTAHV